MAPNWDEPTGATSPQAILFSGNFTIRPLCHERQLHHLATLPTGVTSPCISVEPPCESYQNGRHNEPLPVLPGSELNQSSPKLKTMVVKTISCHYFICLFLPSICNKCMTLSVLETSLQNNVMHFARLVKQASVDLVYDQFV